MLVRRHAALVFAACRRVLRHHQDAEDAFQATFLVFARRAADVWPREAVGSWLFGVAHRVALKARTTRGRRVGPERPLTDVECTEAPRPDFDLADAVHRVVARLPDVYRAAVVACDLQGLSRKEAAERLGWSEGTLSGRLSRARELLARRFRQTGLELPTAGFVAVLTASETVSAAFLKTTIELATATGRSGMSAPVAALTEGMVRSMVLLKFKTMTAAVFAACALGFGAFAATGAGGGDGPGLPQPPKELGTGGGAAPAAPPPPAPVKLPTDRDRFQGTWRIVTITGGGKTTATNPKDPWVIEIAGDTLRMPYVEGHSGSTGSSSRTTGTSEGTTGGTSSTASSGGASADTTASGSGGMPATGWKQREYTFTVEPPKNRPDAVGAVDLKAARKPVVKGIYEFTAPLTTCTKCHGPNNAAGLPLVGNVKDLEPLGLCAPGLASMPSDGTLGLRLAFSSDDTRPTKFGGEKTTAFELIRQSPQSDAPDREVEKRKRLEARLSAARNPEEKALAEAELKALARLVELRRAEAALEQARVEVAAAKIDLERATATLKVLQVKVAVAEQTVAELKRPRPADGAAPDGPVFTVHIRPLKAAEKVVRVKATGNETVLEGLVYAADDVPLKSDGVSAWVVRDNEVLAIDLPGITKKGQTGTNYILKAGDQLFVQAKPGK